MVGGHRRWLEEITREVGGRMKLACDSCMQIFDEVELDMSWCPVCGDELKEVSE